MTQADSSRCESPVASDQFAMNREASKGGASGKQNAYKIFVFGYPGDIGGASTECWHTIKLWKRRGLDVHLIPTWHANPQWVRKLDALGCVTHATAPDTLGRVPGLAGSIVVGFCNRGFIEAGPRLRRLGCKLVWLNCMTFLFEHEKKFFADFGPPDVMIYQSQFQRSELEAQMASFGYRRDCGYLIRGAFDSMDWDFQPRPHEKGSAFVVGRAARPDPAKWSSKTWDICTNIPYPKKRALMLGVDGTVLKKIGPPPEWADCLTPGAMKTKAFYETLHCMIPVNGGARENWPQAGLEAFAAGVPVVAPNAWGWREMIRHGETGFLADDDKEISRYAGLLADDETLRRTMAKNARKYLEDELAAPERLWERWKSVFDRLVAA